MDRANLSGLALALPRALWGLAGLARNVVAAGHPSRPSLGLEVVRSAPAPDRFDWDIRGQDHAEIYPGDPSPLASKLPGPADPYRDLRRHLLLAAVVVVFVATLGVVVVLG